MGAVNSKDPDTQAAEKSAKKVYFGVAMLCGSNQERYIKMVEELQNYFVKVNVNYPYVTTEAYKLLVNYKASYKPQTILVDELEDLLFTDVGGNEESSNSYKSDRGGRERKVQ